MRTLSISMSRKQLWDSMPQSVHNFLSPAIKLLPPSMFFGSQFRKNVTFLKATEYNSSDELYDYQLRKLKFIIKLAYEKSLYYRNSFNEIGFHPGDLRELSDVCKLPLIDKVVIRDNLDDMCTLPITHHSVEAGSTGATGGEPLTFYMNKARSSIEYAYLTTSWQRIGYRLGDTMAVFRGSLVEPNSKGLRHRYDPLLRHHYYSNFHMTEENIYRYLDHVKTIGPCYLHVYPSSANALARFMMRNKIKSPENIKGIIAESENIYEEQRRRIETIFNCRLFSLYGHSEKLVLASECENSKLNHVWPTYGYCELIDENNNPITTPGMRGEIIGTGFMNDVQPLIRYRTGDYATYVSDRCKACGRSHMILADIKGHRTQEMLIASDRSEISWTALNMHDDTFTNVRQFQFYQDTPGKGTLKIVPSVSFGDEDRRRIEQRLDKKLDGKFTFNIKLCHKIPLSPRGKTIYVDQQTPKEFREGASHEC